MKVIQLIPTITYGDAVSNHCIAIDRLLRSMGFKTGIYADGIGASLPAGTAQSVRDLPQLTKEDVVIYHGAIGSELNYLLPKLPCRKIMIYHNITPPEFFHGFCAVSEQLCRDGLEQMRFLADKLDYCIADSEFNKQDLLRMGFTCPIDVCPLLIAFSDYEKAPSEEVIRRYRDGHTNLLFVGRLAPNKKQENVIRAFYFYHKFLNPKSRLFLAGSGEGAYPDALRNYVAALGLQDSVIFPGHIKFNELLAYYHVADAFVCMSEHEGFCVPLVEAMYFDIPIIALSTSAIPWTLGGSGVLLESSASIPAAETIYSLTTDKARREAVLQSQRARLRDFDPALVAEELKALLTAFLAKS